MVDNSFSVYFSFQHPTKPISLVSVLESLISNMDKIWLKALSNFPNNGQKQIAKGQ